MPKISSLSLLFVNLFASVELKKSLAFSSMALIDHDNLVARYLKPTASGFREAAALIRSGKLVAFPTETVYGLGANAFDESAVKLIFEMKNRPLSDPVIVHISSLDQGLSLVELTAEGQRVFHILASAFWPGALTLVAQAVPLLPRCLTANTGFVGIRYPSHPLACRLIQESGCPIAAPSANRFGHVSPTRASHVMDDLGHCDIAVLDGDNCPDTNEPRHLTCEHGIESTVCKIDAAAKRLVIYRQGAVTLAAIQRVLEGNDLNDYTIEVIKKYAPIETDGEGADGILLGNPPQKKTRHDKPTCHSPSLGSEEIGQEAPGQLITHYAPEVPTFMCKLEDWTQERVKSIDLSKVVVLDFGTQLCWLEGEVLAYSNLSTSSSVREAAQRLFSSLRWAEAVPGAKIILLPDISSENDEYAAGVADRIFRSASGKYFSLPSHTEKDPG